MVKGKIKTIKLPKMALPQGAAIVERPAEVDLLLRSKSKWLSTARNLEDLTGLQAVELPLGDLMDRPNSKVRLNTMKQGIKKAWKDLGHNAHEVRFYVNSNKALVWVNRHP